MTIEERLAAVEARVAELTRHPVRDELLPLRDVHGKRLGTIEARLGEIERRLAGVERDVSIGGWIDDRLEQIDDRLEQIVAELTTRRAP